MGFRVSGFRLWGFRFRVGSFKGFRVWVSWFRGPLSPHLRVLGLGASRLGKFGVLIMRILLFRVLY